MSGCTRAGGRTVAGLLVAVLTAVALWWTQGGAGDRPEPGTSPSPTVRTAEPTGPTETAEPTGTAEDGSGGSDPASGLPLVALADLPPEAADTVDLIESGGPFPYDRDGITFENREEILPDRAGGYYREYTVETPGVDHRGARRIVTGAAGELYWTDDHYASFSRIRP